MRNFQIRGFKKCYFLLILTLIFCTGCVATFSTVKTKDPELKGRYYTASFDKAVNAVVEAASKTRDWEVQDVDDVKGFVTVFDPHFMGGNVITIHISKTSSGKIKVDLLSRSYQGTIIAKTKNSILEFYDNLDSLLR